MTEVERDAYKRTHPRLVLTFIVLFAAPVIIVSYFWTLGREIRSSFRMAWLDAAEQIDEAKADWAAARNTLRLERRR